MTKAEVCTLPYISWTRNENRIDCLEF